MILLDKYRILPAAMLRVVWGSRSVQELEMFEILLEKRRQDILDETKNKPTFSEHKLEHREIKIVLRDVRKRLATIRQQRRRADRQRAKDLKHLRELQLLVSSGAIKEKDVRIKKLEEALEDKTVIEAQLPDAKKIMEQIELGGGFIDPETKKVTVVEQYEGEKSTEDILKNFYDKGES